MELKYFFRPKLIRKVVSLAHKNKKSGFIRAGHAHASYGHELIYLDYGFMELTMNGQNAELKPGELILIKGGVEHAFWGRDKLPFDYLNIMFRGELPDFIFNKSMPVDRRMREILMHLNHELEFQESDFPEMTGCLLNELMILLIRQHRKKHAEFYPLFPSNRQHYESEMVEKAVSIIEKNFQIDLKQQEVADAIQISASHLRMLLRKHTGKNFTELLQESRIEAAKHLIREESYTFTQIAGKVGFETPAFFFKLFKRRTGMTPKDYAKSLG